MVGFWSDSEYAAAMHDVAEPYLAARRTEGTFKGYDGTPLFFCRYVADAPRGTAVVVHGFSESAEKYRELICYLLRAGYNVLIHDQRGHGRSPRAVPADLIHVEQFSEYVRDLRCLVEQVAFSCPAPLVLFGHSMGGAVAARYLEKYDGDFDRAVLSSPMIAPARGKMPLFFSRLLCKFCIRTGRAEKRLFVSKKTDDGSEKFEESCSLSRARFDYYAALKAKTPALRGGAPTYRWALESLDVTRRILAAGAPERITVPVLLCSAERDTLVLTAPQRKFIARVARGRMITFDGKHELYASDDAVLPRYFEEVLSFLTAKTGKTEETV